MSSSPDEFCFPLLRPRFTIPLAKRLHDFPAHIRGEIIDACAEIMRRHVREAAAEIRDLAVADFSGKEGGIRGVIAAAKVAGLDVEEVEERLDRTVELVRDAERGTKRVVELTAESGLLEKRLKVVEGERNDAVEELNEIYKKIDAARSRKGDDEFFEEGHEYTRTRGGCDFSDEERDQESETGDEQASDEIQFL